MTTAFTTAARAMWALGDYHRFALSTVCGLGPALVSACGIRAGQRVLDVPRVQATSRFARPAPGLW